MSENATKLPENEELTGAEFNARYANVKMYKLVKEDLTHHGVTFVNGLNVDPIPFNAGGICDAGGIYFTEEQYLTDWLGYIDELKYICPVTVPDDARVYTQLSQKKFKADQLVIDLDGKKTIVDFFNFNDPEVCVNAVTKNINTFMGIPPENKTEDLCELWLCKCPWYYSTVAIKYVPNQTPKLCKIAVERNGSALEYINEQTEELCEIAVKNSGQALEYVKNQTPTLCKLAIECNWSALEYINEQTEELCKLALKINGNAIQHVQNQNEELCELAINNNPESLAYVIEQTESLCIRAIELNPDLIKYVRNPTDYVNRLAVSLNPMTIKYIINPSPAVCEMVDYNLRYIRRSLPLWYMIRPDIITFVSSAALFTVGFYLYRRIGS
jgi:hypothetical protein